MRDRETVPYLIVAILSLLIFSLMTGSFSAFILNAGLMVLTLFFMRQIPLSEYKLYVIVYIVAMIFMFAVYSANNVSFGAPYYKGGSDDIMFERSAMDVIESTTLNPQKLVGSTLDRFHNAPFYVVVVALLMKFGELFDGYSTYLPRILNVYFLIWSTMIIAYFLKKYVRFTPTKIHWFIGLFCMTPNILYINGHVFRDTLNLLQILLIVFIIEKIFSKDWGLLQVALLVALPLLIYCTYYTRANSMVFAGILGLFMLAGKFGVKYRYMLLLNIPILISTTFLEQIRFQYFFEKYSEYQTALSSGLSNFIFEQPLFPLGIFLRFAYAFITPFPNFLGLFKNDSEFYLDLIFFLVFVGVVIQIFAIPFILKRMLTIDWLTLSFVLCMLGVVLTTFTFRHVVFYYPFLVAMAVDGYTQISSRSKWLTLTVTLTGMMFMFYIYLQLKV